MEFGISFFPSVGPDDKPATQYYDEAFQVAEKADDLGFAYVRAIEHYFSAYGGYSPDPITFLTAVAARTRNVRLITAATIPAFTHPVKLAGKIAMLDNISHGRVDAGFGRAFLPHEFEAFEISLEESRERFDEGVQACRLLLTEDAAAFSGTFHTFGPVRLLPRPAQQPFPPFYVAAASSPESYEKAGRDGHYLQTALAVSSLEKTREMLGIYRDAWAAAGHRPGAERIQISMPFFLADDDETARRAGEFDHRKTSGNMLEAVSAWQRVRSTQYAGYEKIAESVRRTSFDDLVRQNKILAGSPDTVRKQLDHLVAALGDDLSVALVPHSGNLDPALVNRALELFSDSVLPRMADS
ncbi:LLM class flavin-dependent oxidoreductase [Streptomyces sp. NPDC101393]|uniref:LLM class flavin-dependent oxidoreductase n=1 Tax=Streptomyces sp. NPDC101393 TaxID=3366141 RepID=UPI0037FE2956